MLPSFKIIPLPYYYIDRMQPSHDHMFELPVLPTAAERKCNTKTEKYQKKLFASFTLAEVVFDHVCASVHLIREQMQCSILRAREL